VRRLSSRSSILLRGSHRLARACNTERIDRCGLTYVVRHQTSGIVTVRNKTGFCGTIAVWLTTRLRSTLRARGSLSGEHFERSNSCRILHANTPRDGPQNDAAAPHRHANTDTRNRDVNDPWPPSGSHSGAGGGVFFTSRFRNCADRTAVQGRHRTPPHDAVARRAAHRVTPCAFCAL
jgi:hypothetical protein